MQDLRSARSILCSVLRWSGVRTPGGVRCLVFDATAGWRQKRDGGRLDTGNGVDTVSEESEESPL